MLRIAVIVWGVILGLSLVLIGQARPAIEVLWWLASGWLTYPARVLPKVRVSWDGVTTGVVCLALFAIGLHRTLRWLYGAIRQTSGTSIEGQKAWTVRWTAALVALVVLMFVVGISATAVVHQGGWLIASRRALVEEKRHYLSDDYDDRGTSAAHLRWIGGGTAALRKSPGQSADGYCPDGEVRQSWLTDVLPRMNFILGGELRCDLPWNAPENSAYFKGVVPTYLNPEVGVVRSPEGYALAHYAGNVHVLGPDRAFQRVEAGEASNTILAGEVAEGFLPWGDPANLRDPGLGVNTVPGGFGGPSGSGANFVFVDGSVRFFKDTTSREVLRRLNGLRPPGR